MKKRLTRKQFRNRKRLRIIIRLGTALLLAVSVLSITFIVFGKITSDATIPARIREVFNRDTIDLSYIERMDHIEPMMLTPNPYSRPETPLEKINGVVIHYTANPDTDAEANRNYFENLSIHKTTSVSSHYIIGLDGRIIQCIPLDEIAYASNHRNSDTIAIECCHPDKSGKFNKETYQSLVELTANLCTAYNLGRDDILRHYDITGKACPLYFTDNEEEWETFKDDVMEYRMKN